MEIAVFQNTLIAPEAVPTLADRLAEADPYKVSEEIEKTKRR